MLDARACMQKMRAETKTTAHRLICPDATGNRTRNLRLRISLFSRASGNVSRVATKLNPGFNLYRLLLTLLLGLPVAGANAQTMAPSNGQPDQVSLEMKQLRSGIAVVTVLVNGKNRRFVIDPGSEKTSVSNEVVGLTHERLKTLKQNSTIQATGLTGRAKTVLARTSFALGTMTFDDAIVIVADFSSISDSIGEHVDGLLGQDILARFSKVTFDYKHRLLNLSK